MAITKWPSAPLGTAFSGAVFYHYEPGGPTTAKDVYPTYDDASNSTNALPQPVVLNSVGWPQDSGGTAVEGVFLDGNYYCTLKDSTEATTYFATDDFPGDPGIAGSSALPRGYISGLKLSNDSDADHDVNITAGEARDAADSEDIALATEITKQIDAVWAVGDDAGGLDTGSVTTDTLYYVWLIKRTDTGVVDALFSLSRTSPTLPTSYDKKRLIGCVLTDGSSNIYAFLHDGLHYFRYTGDAIVDVADSTITNETFETAALSVPPSSIAHVYAAAQNTSETAANQRLFVRTNGSADGSTFSITESWTGIQADASTDALAVGGIGAIMVDSSSQIQYACGESAGTATVTISTLGFWMSERLNP